MVTAAELTAGMVILVERQIYKVLEVELAEFLAGVSDQICLC